MKKESTKTKSKLMDNFLNISIFILLIIFLALLAQKFLSNRARELILNEENQKEENVVKNDQLISRVYPENFGEKEKIVLVPQTDDVPKEEHRVWDETLREIGEEAEVLKIIQLGEDCFGDPLVIRVERGSEISVQNTTDSTISFGFSDQIWRIEPGETKGITPYFEIYPDFKMEENPYGYGCGGPYESLPSGLFLVR